MTWWASTRSPGRRRPARRRPGVQAVVIGDSTAAGWGLPWGPKPTAETRPAAARRSRMRPTWRRPTSGTLLNLACGSATIENGLLGPEVLYNGEIAPPQLPQAAAATHAKLIVVSVGADDLSWSLMTQLCAAQTVCDDKVSSAYFTQLLNTFTRNYYQLLSDLDGLSAHPAVLVNEYYSPFGTNVGCLQKYGMSPAKVKVLVARLAQLNKVLQQGANLFGVRGRHPAVHRPRTVHGCPVGAGTVRPGAAAPERGGRAGDRRSRISRHSRCSRRQPVQLPSPSPSPSTHPRPWLTRCQARAGTASGRLALLSEKRSGPTWTAATQRPAPEVLISAASTRVSKSRFLTAAPGSRPGSPARLVAH